LRRNHYEKQIDLDGPSQHVRIWNAMDPIDRPNFGSERASHTESGSADSTSSTATHHAKPVTATSSLPVPDDFSNKSNLTHASADAAGYASTIADRVTDSLNPETSG